jgi:hypothetical protein
MNEVRSVGRFLSDLIHYAVRSGQWWFPALVVVLVTTALVVAAAQAVVPTVVYTLF